MTIDAFVGLHRYLSNFYPDDGGSLEHLYQASKTRDAAWAAKILASNHPQEAKRLGKKAPLDPNWESNKLAVMRALVLQKFLTSPRLADALLSTGDEELIEGNWWGDKFWGVCGGVGQNWLGRILMETRAILRSMNES